MAGERYLRLLDTLERPSLAPLDDSDASLPELAGKAFQRLRKAVRSLPERPSDDELHGVRIETKRARYAAELAEPALGPSGAKLVARARAVQDVIGDHQDACVAEAKLRSLASRSSGRTALAAGRLVERQRQRKQAARRAFPDAWRKLDKTGRAAFS